MSYTTIHAGSTESYQIPLKESADTSETIESATLSGTGASSFRILSSFPVEIPKGVDAAIDVQFAPLSAGTFQAELQLQTAKMGTSQISLTGTGF